MYTRVHGCGGCVGATCDRGSVCRDANRDRARPDTGMLSQGPGPAARPNRRARPDLGTAHFFMLEVRLFDCLILVCWPFLVAY